MGIPAGEEFDGWLSEGGLVVTASERAARAFQAAFHRRRRAEGLSAWPAPNVLDWTNFSRSAWEELSLDGRLILNPTQEQAIWAGIIRDDQHVTTTLSASQNRLARMAMEAQELLCNYSPRLLREAARTGWDHDPGKFSAWLSAFDEVCRRRELLSRSRVPLGLVSLLQSGSQKRPPLLAAGFDRFLPAQRALFDSWGKWQPATQAEASRHFQYHEANDSQSELEACAYWCHREILANPQTRLLVIAQDISMRRGEIERALLRYNRSGSSPLFEFSLGIPLSQVPLARAASLLLKWLDGPLDETEVDWLLSSTSAASPQEAVELQAYMRGIRDRGLQRTQWSFQAFATQSLVSAKLPASWLRRMTEAQAQSRKLLNGNRSHLEWADKVPQMLQSMGWGGEHALGSAEFQAIERWQEALDTVGSLGFDGQKVVWSDFLQDLTRALNDTLYAPQSLDAPVQIAGPAESAGLNADTIWFLGADEDAWPAVGSTHPLLPIQVQREAAMPHSTAQSDWDLSFAITARLAASAPRVHFSYSRLREGVDKRASRLILKFAEKPIPMASELIPAPIAQPSAISYSDRSYIPFAAETVRGGAGVLTSQSRCPFQAFATARLGARDWESAEAGLSAAQRGQLLHAVLHVVWGGPPAGLRALNDLCALQDVPGFVSGIVHNVLSQEMPAAVRDRMPARYLELEEVRLTALVVEWLNYEAERVSFTVSETEAKHTINLAGLVLSLRLDRIDQLNDGSFLVVDYKTGDVSQKDWELPRPDDVQLPLYAGFALKEKLGGLVFAKVRTREPQFAGRVVHAAENLRTDLGKGSALVKDPLTDAQISDWKQYIEQLACDFVAGRADVDPREYPNTCKRCGLHALCRVHESRALTEDEEIDEELEDA